MKTSCFCIVIQQVLTCVLCYGVILLVVGWKVLSFVIFAFNLECFRKSDCAKLY